MKRVLITCILMSILVSVSQAKTVDSYERVTAKSGLTLRKSAGLKSEKIVVIPHNARVKVTKLSTDYQVIDGVKGRWVKIDWYQFSGWVFDAYLEEVSTTDPVVTYEIKLTHLDKTDPNSISKAKDLFRGMFLKRPSLQEHGFRIFMQYYLQVLQEIQKQIESDPGLSGIGYLMGPSHYKNIDPDHITEKDISILKRELSKIHKDQAQDYLPEKKIIKMVAIMARNGVAFECGEGESWTSTDYYYLCDTVLKGCSGEIVAYYELLKEIDSVQLAADAGYLISWEEMRLHIIKAEQFYHKYSRFYEARYVLPSLIELRLYAYLMGADNTPVMDYEGVLRQEVKDSYRLFLKENRDSSFYPYLGKLYELYEAAGFNSTKEISALKAGILSDYRNILDQ